MEQPLISGSDSMVGAMSLMCEFLELLPVLLCHSKCFDDEEDQDLVQPSNNTSSFFSFGQAVVLAE